MVKRPGEMPDRLTASESEFNEWLGSYRKYWHQRGIDEARFPHCACQIPEDDEDAFEPCELHLQWKNGLIGK